MKKEDQSVYASILLRRGKNIIRRDRSREGFARVREGEGNKEGSIRIRQERRKVQRIRKMNRNMCSWGQGSAEWPLERSRCKGSKARGSQDQMRMTLGEIPNK